MEHNFKDSDKDQVIEFLNFVATKAEFKLNTQDVIKYFKLLSYMQKELLVKIDKNVLELKRVIDNSETSEE